MRWVEQGDNGERMFLACNHPNPVFVFYYPDRKELFLREHEMLYDGGGLVKFEKINQKMADFIASHVVSSKII